MKKSEYKTPAIETIELDNQIALALQSEPPVGPEEVLNYQNHSFNQSPFEATENA